MTSPSTTPPTPPAAPPWRDRKRYAWLLGLAVPTLPFQAAALVAVSDWSVLWWWGPFFAFVIIPVLDAIIGPDRENPPDEAIGRLEEDRYYRWCTYLYLPLQYAGLLYACLRWADGMSVPDALGLAATVGVVAGVAINTAHELGHKRETVERRLARIALAQAGYGHFYVEHNHGHHIRVATPEDPASSRLGESLWAFLPRTVAGSARSAWRLEARRLNRRRHPTWSYHNDVLTAWALTTLLFATLAAGFGPVVLPYLLVQAACGILLLESVNYLEHYGLLRERRPDGRYERVAPRHSWNSNNTTSNIFLYQLQRHSDHHANPLRRYQTLRHFDEAPQLPSGYASMIVLAWATPLWRRVMDPRVLAHYDDDVRRTNLHGPRAHRYGAPTVRSPRKASSRGRRPAR
ncbi:alkane 1-monooxygenase [Streptomyces sp. NPDC056405]|uniref:alkane 1-monooxygenase n=1 Tax=Streptomyces sp. NPDC056405 TaxID=3345811 RepID=UPI0035D931AC